MTLDELRRASASERARFGADLVERVGRGFTVIERIDSIAFPLPTFLHAATETEWVYVPEHSFTMGCSASEERAARRLEDPPQLTFTEMRPAHERRVRGFLCMTRPVSRALVERLLPEVDLDGRPALDGPDRVAPAYLRRSEVEALGARLGFLLPTEEQWECACRAGTQTLFFFGDDLPDQDEALEAYAGSDLSRSQPNPFGLHGLFVGEWCRERWKPSHEADAPASEEDFVVRGGASLFWPWQGSEWAYCVSSFRMPSSDAFDGACAARFVVEPRESREEP